MAISGIAPAADTLIDSDLAIVFLVDDTYTYLRIEVFTEGLTEYAYDSTLGGAQSGYSVSVANSGGVDTFTVTPDSGWDNNPQVIQVVEDETGTEATTELSWNIAGAHGFPQDTDPYYGMFSATFKVTEDDVGGAANVGWIDVVGPVSGVDGISIEDLGDGKVRLTANATSNDPDAIHVDVANEISAIAEKTVPHDDDLVIIEDSEAGFVKKKVQRKNMGIARNPAKLSADDSPPILYHFDGDLTNSGSEGSLYDLDVEEEGGFTFFTPGTVPFAYALGNDRTDGWNTGALGETPSAAVAAVGEMTLQAVFMIENTVPHNSLTIGNIISLATGGLGNDACWAFRAGLLGNVQITPMFQYTDIDEGIVQLGDDTEVAGGFRFAANTLHHMVARRVSVGGGLYDVSLWLNGFKVYELTDQKAAIAPTSSHLIRVTKSGTQNGFCRCGLEGFKLINSAMTDAEILVEYRAVVGSPVI
jgi:hypothetical protein